MPDSSKISACIMVRNEEKNLPGLLASIRGVVDEIVAIDHESTDKSANILRKAGARLIQLPNVTVKKWGDLERPLFNNKAKYGWILRIDADERLTEELRTVIPNLIKQHQYDIIWLLSKHFYAPGKYFKYGFYAPHREPRLYRKSCKIDWNVKIHEPPKFEGRHFYSNLAYDHLYYTAGRKRIIEKHELYLKVEREQKKTYLSKNSIIMWFFIISGYFFYFLYSFFLKLAFLDGWVGITTNHFLAKYFARAGYFEIYVKRKLGVITYSPMLDDNR